jgi:transposase
MTYLPSFKLSDKHGLVQFAPSSLRHLPCGEIISLKVMARPVLRLRQPSVFPVLLRTVAQVLCKRWFDLTFLVVSCCAIPALHRFEGSFFMDATNEFLTRMPRSSDANRHWPVELKARIVAETLIEGATVNGVAKRYGLIPSIVSDWRRIARTGKLVLPNLDGMDFVPVQIEDPKPLEVAPAPPINLTNVELLEGGVTIRLAADISAARIAEIAAAL